MLLLCLDVGNSHIFGGVFNEKEIALRFRYTTQNAGTSDQFGLFFRQVLRENNIDPGLVKHISVSSVVPSLDYSISSGCIKYFKCEPFIIKAGVKTGLKILVHNPLELGADRIANAIAAIEQFPRRDLIVIDFGTATTVCAISAHKEYLGGIIMPGLKTAAQSLSSHTAKLPSVDIVRPLHALGKNTEQHIQSGLYYGHIGALKEIISQLKQEAFADRQPIIIGTGGFAHLFEDKKLFDAIISDLVLHGLRIAWQKNHMF